MATAKKAGAAGEAAALPFGTAAPTRRYLAANVIALWPEDRPAVGKQALRGKPPRGVHRLLRCNRLRPGVYAYLWNKCLPQNRGTVVQLLNTEPDHDLPNTWMVRSITAPLAQIDIVTGEVAIWPQGTKGRAQEHNLRRCPAPKGYAV